LSISLHRRWLASALRDINWQEDQHDDEWDESDRPFARLSALAQFGRARDAVRWADAMAARFPQQENRLYQAAVLHALAAGSWEDEDGLSAKCTARAVALLRQAAQAGFKDVNRLIEDPDLVMLHHRQDFMQFLWDMAESR
jgi:hypothetical protein